MPVKTVLQNNIGVSMWNNASFSNYTLNTSQKYLIIFLSVHKFHKSSRLELFFTAVEMKSSFSYAF